MKNTQLIGNIKLIFFKNNEEDMKKYLRYKKIDFFGDTIPEWSMTITVPVLFLSWCLTIISLFSGVLYNYIKLDILKNFKTLFTPTMNITLLFLSIFTIFLIVGAIHYKLYYRKMASIKKEYFCKTNFINAIKEIDKTLLKEKDRNISYEEIYSDCENLNKDILLDYLISICVEGKERGIKKENKYIKIIKNKISDILELCLHMISLFFYFFSILTLVMEIFYFIDEGVSLVIAIPLLLYTFYLMIMFSISKYF